MRRKDREITDKAEIIKIFDSGLIVHLGLVDKGKPYIVPMNYGYEVVDGNPVLFMHSALEGYKIDIIKENPNCCFEIETELNPYEGDVACQYGMAFKSVIGWGNIQIINDVEEKKRAFSVFMKSQTGKDFEFNDKLVSAVHLLKLVVDEYTAKNRPVPRNAKPQKIIDEKPIL